MTMPSSPEAFEVRGRSGYAYTVPESGFGEE
jgi:hypothetical protein